MTITVLLVDDQTMVRAGFRLILESDPGLRVVFEAADGAAAVDAVVALRPDVVLMDVQMPGMDGLEATRRIRVLPGETPAILILTTFERDDYIFAALRAGASGFLLKNAPPEDLITAIRVVAGGEALLAPSVTRRVLESFTGQAPTPERPVVLDRLTERERDVLGLVARGLTNAEIADRLFVGEATVKTHVSNLLAKLGLRDRIQAVVFAYENGVVQPGAT